MKFKIPNIYLHSDSGRELRYDPETQLFDTADPDDRVVHLSRLKPRLRKGPLAQLKRWCRKQTRLYRTRASVKSGGRSSAAIAPHLPN